MCTDLQRFVTSESSDARYWFLTHTQLELTFNPVPLTSLVRTRLIEEWDIRPSTCPLSLPTCTFPHSATSGFPRWLIGSGWLVTTAPCGAASENTTFHDEAQMTDGTSPLSPLSLSSLLFPVKTLWCVHLGTVLERVRSNVNLWQTWAAWLRKSANNREIKTPDIHQSKVECS